MNSILKLFFISILFNSILFAQDNFHNIYSVLGNNSKGLIVKKVESGNYIIAALIDSILTEVKVDEQGQIITNIPLTQTKHDIADVDFTTEGGYVFIKIVENTNGLDHYLVKLDSNKQFQWENYIFTQSGGYSKVNVISTTKQNILLSYNNSDDAFNLNVIYLTRDGNILWETQFSNTPSFTAGYPIAEIRNGTFIVSSNKSIFNVNESGDSLWSYNSDFLIKALDQYKSDDNIIIGTIQSLIKLSQDGELITSTEYPSILLRELNSLSAFDDNSIAAFTANDNLFFSPAFELTNKITTKLNITDSHTDGDYFYGTGTFEKSDRSSLSNISFTKWNKNQLPIKNIILFSPNGGESYPQENSSYPDKFPTDSYSEGIDSIIIEFSYDGGLTWNVNEENSSFIEIPYINSDECLVRISDADDPSIFDISTSYFSIRAYRYQDYIAGNECFMWIGNNGMSAHNPITDDCGFFWPGGENATIPSIFTDGILWGGIHKGMIKVNGSTWRDGLKPGAILPDGTAGDPTKSEYSIFKLKKDWQSLPPGIEKDRMHYTYNNWPGELGAPFEDVNNDGIFTNGVDVPKILGEETLFYVANDLDSTRTAYTYGSPPIGLEFQQTLFAYNTPEIKDAVFKKVKLINKSNSPIDSMYIAYWNDDDLGFAGDDFVGCDTNLNLIYTYNGDNDDEDDRGGYGPAPPAVGRVLLQGPIVKGIISDSAKIDGRYLQGYKNLPMTSTHLYIDYIHYNNPTLGMYEGTKQFYNQMSGKINNGDPIIDPITQDTIQFVLAGDPVNGTGWYEGEGWPGGPVPDDRRSLMSSGPFTMAPGDTQEVVYAIFMARGSSNIQSITELRKTAKQLHEFWGNDIPVSVNRNNNTVPAQFSLSQNYPNPFNPTTTIKYTLPAVRHGIPSSSVISNPLAGERSQSSNKSEISPSGRNDNANVELTVYDILGRKVKTLVNKKQSPGNYEVEFNASKLASGIYFYQLRTADFLQVKKMIYLK